MAKVGDTVLVFNLFEGTILEVKDNEVVLYCPEYDEEQPYLVTTDDNFILLASGTSKYIN